MPYRKIKNKTTGPKATAWRWFAKYIKLRDAIQTTGTIDRAVCITCNKEYLISDMDAGHMIPGRTGGILFDETIVFAQCRMCNREGNGEREAFKKIMVERHGYEWYEAKESARRTPVKLGDFEYKLIAEEYKERYNDLQRIYQEGYNV